MYLVKTRGKKYTESYCKYDVNRNIYAMHCKIKKFMCGWQLGRTKYINNNVNTIT